MAAETMYYQNSQTHIIRKESEAIINSVLKFHFHLDSALSSLNTIQAELLTLLDEKSRFASKENLQNYDYMRHWMTSFFRKHHKAYNKELSYDFLFYGAALTINKFLDDHHL